MIRRMCFFLVLLVGILTRNASGFVIAQDGSGTPVSLLNAYRIEQQAVLGRGTAKVVAWSPNGKQLAVGSTAGIWLYDTSDYNAPPHRLETLVDLVDMAYSPDGSRLAIVSSGGAVIMWDAVTGARFEILDHYQLDSHHRIAFSADSKVLAVRFSSRMHLWDVETRARITNLITNPSDTLGISRIPYSVVSSASDSAWTLVDTTASGPQTLTYKQGKFMSLNRDGTVLAIAELDGTVQLVDAQSGDAVRSLDGHALSITCVDFNADGVTLVSASRDGSMRIWNTVTGEPVYVLNELSGEVQSAAFNIDGTLLASATESKVRLWDSVTGDILHIFEGYTAGDSFYGGETLAVAYSPDGTMLASGAADSTVSLWDARTGQRQSVLYGHVVGVSSLAYSPDGTILASGSYDHTIRLWDTATGTTQRILLKDTQSMVTDLAFNPSGTVLAAATHSSNVLLWNVNTGALFHELEGHTGLITSVLFSPDGAVLASGSVDTTIRLWDMTDYASLAVLTGHTETVTDVAFNSAGDRLASTSIDGMVRLWSVPEGIPVNALSANSVRWETVAFSLDGTVLVSGGAWGALRFWNPDTGVILADLSAYAETIRDIALSPIGDTVATADADGVVRLWRISPTHTELQPGVKAAIHVTGDETLNVRDKSGIDGTIIGVLSDETQVIVREGPQENGGYTWWRVETPAGALGWVVESADGIQTLVP